MALEPPLNDPDWGRYLMPPGRPAPVGDYTKWGGRVTHTLVNNSPDVLRTAPIISVATTDGYSRSWGILGNLIVPPSLINDPNALVMLECSMGVGQVTIVHNIALMIGSGGLVNSQSAVAGGAGPYWTSDEGFAFAAIGSLIGQSITIRGLFLLGAVFPGLPAPATIALVATPFAAGEGL